MYRRALFVGGGNASCFSHEADGSVVLVVSIRIALPKENVMPLKRGTSTETVARSIKAERKHGKPKKQAVAIAVNDARNTGIMIPKKSDK
jgi:hypothetical protein